MGISSKHRTAPWLWTAMVAAALAGCGPDDGASAPAVEDAPIDDPVRSCVPGDGVDARPETIEGAVALLNSLPRPASVACYVESLGRPLRVVASSSGSSAQPAVGMGSPRIFLFQGPLITAVVPAGTGADLVEFGQLIGAGQSIKGELVFPFAGPAEPEAPYAHLEAGLGVTSCAFCHPNEQAEYQIGTATAYRSRAFRPLEATLVDIEDLRDEVESCDPDVEPQRCDLLRELFGNGEVVPGEFPESLHTFFE